MPVCPLLTLYPKVTLASFSSQHFKVLPDSRSILTSQFPTSPHSCFWVMLFVNFHLCKYQDCTCHLWIHSAYTKSFPKVLKIFMCICINHVVAAWLRTHHRIKCFIPSFRSQICWTEQGPKDHKWVSDWYCCLAWHKAIGFCFWFR